MDRTTAANYVTIGGKRQFQNANPGAGISVGTDLDAVDHNAWQEEIVTAIVASGQAPNAADLSQLSKAIEAAGAVGTLAFSATGSWTAPAGVISVKAKVWGAGAGGGASPAAGSAAGGGGGAGYAEGVFAVTPGTSYAVTIGAPGSGGTGSSSNSGTAGGTSSFASFCSALGGQGGSGAASGAVAAGGAGGSATGGTVNATGGNGAGGQFLGSWFQGGAGGAAFGVTLTSGSVAQGSLAYGSSGGGGGANGGGGGNGGSGLVILEW